jgi:transcriptional regulator with XRE-family HTH domain
LIFEKNMFKNANIVGQNVIRFRHQAGWSQDVLAAKMQLLGCGITREIIANIETRRSAVTDKQIVILAEIFRVEVGLLFPPIFRGAKGEPDRKLLSKGF